MANKYMGIILAIILLGISCPTVYGAATETSTTFKSAQEKVNSTYKDFKACTENCGSKERAFLDATNALQSLQNASTQGQTQALAEQGINICDYLPCVGKIYSSEDPITYAAELIITNFTRIASAFAVLAFIIGGGMILTSLGEDAQMTKGKNIMIASAIGLVIIFSAYVVVSFIEQIFYSLGK